MTAADDAPAPGPLETYVAAFVARCEARQPAGSSLLRGPSLFGALAAPEDPAVRLLVVDDAAHDALAARLPDVAGGLINVFDAAPRCRALLAAHPGWSAAGVTTMTHDALDDVPGNPLPDGLRLRAVARRDGDDGVPLDDAVAAATEADPSVDDAAALATYLRGLADAFRLLAAIDDDGRVRATAGAGVFGPAASVAFVNTVPSWRGRGLGTAMTAAALRVAREAGATVACLDATDAAVSIYRRLGFASLGGATHFLSAA